MRFLELIREIIVDFLETHFFTEGFFDEYFEKKRRKKEKKEKIKEIEFVYPGQYDYDWYDCATRFPVKS